MQWLKNLFNLYWPPQDHQENDFVDHEKDETERMLYVAKMPATPEAQKFYDSISTGL